MASAGEAADWYAAAVKEPDSGPLRFPRFPAWTAELLAALGHHPEHERRRLRILAAAAAARNALPAWEVVSPDDHRPGLLLAALATWGRNPGREAVRPPRSFDLVFLETCDAAFDPHLVSRARIRPRWRAARHAAKAAALAGSAATMPYEDAQLAQSAAALRHAIWATTEQAVLGAVRDGVTVAVRRNGR